MASWCLDHLLYKAGISNFDIDVDSESGVVRSRKFYSSHSTRVTGCCMLLRCGLLPAAISAMAEWESDMVSRYEKRLLLNPNIVEPLGFDNPSAMRNHYGRLGNGLQNTSNAKQQ